MVILAGSTLGGGTTINWSASFRTPNNVLHEWSKQYGISDFATPLYQNAMDSVSQRMSVNIEHGFVNPQNQIVEAGAEDLGYSHKPIPRNALECPNCGFCNLGCRYSKKQGTVRTYLQDAVQAGARVLVGTHVDKILVNSGNATGIEATVKSNDRQYHQVMIHANAVVVAAGSLHTPAILLRSGLTNPHIGRNLHLHPTTVTYGIYEKAIRGWDGPIMTRYVDEFKNLDGRGYGCILETAPINPAVGAATLSWADGLQHKRTMSQLRNLANIIVLTRDKGSGRVSVDRKGQPIVDYTLDPWDAQHMMRGVLETIKIHAANNAREIGAPYAYPLTWHPDDSLDNYLREVSRHPLTPNSFALFSAHQMSSCRMADSPTLGAITPNGETFEVKNLYVADGSVLPTASGVNPMLTIMSTAYMIAGYIKSAHQA